MKKIEFILSDRLYENLFEIKEKLTETENLNVEYSDMIEESLMSYYDISIVDTVILKKEMDDDTKHKIVDIINNRKNADEYYVYMFFNLRNRIDRHIADFYFEYEPIYVGKGKDERINDISKHSRNTNLVEFISDLKKTNDFKSKKILINLNNIDAHNFETFFIETFGKLVDNTGSLYNKQNGCNLVESNNINITNSELNLEYNEIQNIILALNTNKTIKKSAIILNVSERTLYRKIKRYSIKKNKRNKEWNFEV